MVFESNLVSIISFYAYMILGMDQDTFVLESGNLILKQHKTLQTLRNRVVTKAGAKLMEIKIGISLSMICCPDHFQ